MQPQLFFEQSQATSWIEMIETMRSLNRMNILCRERCYNKSIENERSANSQDKRLCLQHLAINASFMRLVLSRSIGNLLRAFGLERRFQP